MKTLKYKLNNLYESLYEIYKKPKPEYPDLTLPYMDIVLVKNNNPNEKIVVKANDVQNGKLEDYKDDYTPIGIVVIPASHDVYGTGEAGVLSLKYMRYDTPDDGGNNQDIYWGQYKVDTELPNLDKVANYGAMNGGIQDALQNPMETGSLPTDFNSDKKSKTEGLKYYSPTSSSYGYIPSPYLTDGSRNPDYYDTTVSTEANALSDFNGKENTDKLCELATKQSDWKTAATITNKSDAGYSPAACCCWRYHTLGTNQGDWYFPACGELGYVVTRRNAIDNTVTSINKLWSSSAVLLSTRVTHSSSSASSSTMQRDVSFNGGGVNWYGKYSTTYVRAFLRLAL